MGSAIQGQIFFHFSLDIFSDCHIMDMLESFGVWLSLVERTTGGREVASSSLVTPMAKALVLQGLFIICVAFRVLQTTEIAFVFAYAVKGSYIHLHGY